MSYFVTALISAVITSLFATLGFLGRRWFSKSDGEKDQREKELKHMSDVVAKMKVKVDTEIGKIPSIVSREVLDSVVIIKSEIDTNEKDLSDIKTNQGRNFERLNSLDATFKRRIFDCPHGQKIGGIESRLNKLDGGDQFGQGQVAANARDIGTLREVMSIAGDVKKISEAMGTLASGMNSLKEEFLEFKLEISEKYLSKEEYEKDSKALNKKLNKLIMILMQKIPSGVRTNLQVIIDDDSDSE